MRADGRSPMIGALRLLMAAALLAAAPLARAQQTAAECLAAAGVCVAQCAISGIIGGGLQACRAQCAQQQRQCAQQVTVPLPPAVASPAGGTAPGPVVPGTTSPAPVAATSAARHPHIHPLKTVTSAGEIVPVEVPAVGGVPVIGYSTFLLGQPLNPDAGIRGEVNVLRWLALMHIAQRPAVLDADVAAKQALGMFAPPEVWDQYAVCASSGNASCTWLMQEVVKRGRDALESYRNTGKALRWRGANEFERTRSHKAFVEKYGPILSAQAAALPQEVILFSQIVLPTYSKTSQAIPLLDRQGNFIGFDAGATSALPILGPYCAPTTVQWPKQIAASPAEAEALLNRLTERQAYLALRVRLHRIDGDQLIATATLGQSGVCRSDAEVLELSLYADAALKTRLMNLPLSAAPRAASTGPMVVPEAATARPSPVPAAAALPGGPAVALCPHCPVTLAGSVPERKPAAVEPFAAAALP